MSTPARTTLCALALMLLGAGSAHAAPGPKLLEPRGALSRALDCSGPLSTSARPPVLLVHGTGSNPAENWRWGYRRVLPARGFPTCTVRLPERGLSDIQRNVEYVVSSVRLMHRRAGRKIAMIGLSQGGLLPVLALKFWPDLAGMVEDYVGLAPVGDRGSRFFDVQCASGCATAGSQFRTASRLLAAFARRPLPAGPSYTTVSTATDEVLTPAPSASRLRGARNLVIQDRCPSRRSAHFEMAGDAVAYAYALDALTHPGPASPGRVAPAVCRQHVLPGAIEEDLAELLAGIIRGVTEAMDVASSAAEVATSATAEPTLRCYLLVTCSDPEARGRMLASVRRGPGSLRLRVQAAGELRIVTRQRVRTLRVREGRLRVGIAGGPVLLQTRPEGYRSFSTESTAGARRAS